MGRLEDIKKTVPRMIEQRDSEVIVVDYNCPMGTGLYVSSVLPQAKVVKESKETYFNLCRARNLGAREARGEILIFLDSDVLVADNFTNILNETIKENMAFYTFPQLGMKFRGLYGSCVVPRDGWMAIQGYDEVIEGAGGNDKDFYFRLSLAGYKRSTLPGNSVERVLANTEQQRTAHYKERNRLLSVLLNSCYRQIKNQILVLSRSTELSIAARKTIRDSVNASYKRMIELREHKMTVLMNIPQDGTALNLKGAHISRFVGAEIEFRGRDGNQIAGVSEE
jgi:hypothetical protein